MLVVLILILAVLWFFGYIHVGGINVPNFPLFTVNGQNISLWDLLIFLLVVLAISGLPWLFRAIAGVLLVLWVLSLLGILAIPGANLTGILVVLIIVGLIVSLFMPARTTSSTTVVEDDTI